jgi:maltoporin
MLSLLLTAALLGPVAARAETPPTPPAQDSAAVQRLLTLLEGFHFGTYGRIGISGDLREGSKGKPVNVVTHGPRLEESPYVELDLGYELQRKDALSFRVLSTVAFGDDFFHYNGKWEAKIALRNIFAEATHVLTPHLSLWVGSRMYRGDDIYLLDYWPLDNLNTVGAGIGLRFGRTQIALHGGASRLDNIYQLQQLEVPSARFGTDTVTVLDRQRAVFSLKATHERDLTSSLSGKASLYGEFHRLPVGTIRTDQGLEREEWPADNGWVAGLQLGLWGFGPSSFVNFWIRFAGGLAAYGDLSVPSGLDKSKQASGARETVIALMANFERKRFGLMAGGYVRYFRDADSESSDPDDGWEYVAVVRPHLFLHRYFHQVFEISYQGRRPNGINGETQTHLVPSVFKFSIMPTLSWDRGCYSRPQVRAVYTVSYLDSGAQLMFPLEDPRRGQSLVHFLGVQVEWWYHSSYR